MSRRIFTAFVCMVFIAAFSLPTIAQVHDPGLTMKPYMKNTNPMKQKPIENATLLSGPRIVIAKSASCDFILGEIDTAGYTYNDEQHNSSIGRMIALDPESNVHVSWMCAYDPAISTRHIRYNFRESVGSWEWLPDVEDEFGGVPAEGSFRGGYATIAVNSLTYPFPAFHQRVSTLYHAAVSTDWSYIASPPERGGFMASELSACIDTISSEDLECIWPKIAVDRHDSLHIIATSSLEGEDQLSYWKGVCSEELYNILYTDCLILEENTELLSADIAASPTGDKIAVVYIKDMDTTYCAWTNHYNIVYFESEDLGETWSDMMEVTDYGPRPTDTADLIFWYYDAAGAESVYVYTRPMRDCNVMYDNDDNLHITWTEQTFIATRTDPCDDSMLANGTIIKHWSDETGIISDVIPGPYFGSNFSSSIPDNPYRSWPSLMSPEISEGPDGNLYIIFQKYSWDWYGGFMTTPDDSLYYVEYDLSEASIPNKDVYAVMSDDGGLTWGAQVNITNTHTPYAAPDSCADETDPSLALVVDDYLHISYVLDKEAGSVLDEGAPTFNPFIYQKTPTSEIPGPGECYISFLWSFENQLLPRIYTDGSTNDTCDVVLVRWYLFSDDAYRIILSFSADGGLTFTDQDTGLADSVIGLWWEMPEPTDTIVAELELRVENEAGDELYSATSGIFYIFYEDDFIRDSHKPIPAAFSLSQNYPNPFNASTTIPFTVSTPAKMNLTIYNIKGELVKSLVYEDLTPGQYRAIWNGTDNSGSEVGSGIYFCMLESSGQKRIKNMVFMK
ncbi:T9SS type A sorting domain-containing protein [bacterium]|nr:T9SS type A sorting domain-containing protein [bacterium]